MYIPDLREVTFGYSTLASRIGRVRLPQPSGGAEVLLCVQDGAAPHTHPDARGPSATSAARVVAVPGLGVARSRNAAIFEAGRRYLMFCDDDITVDIQGVAQALAHLREHGVALVLGCSLDAQGRTRKRTPCKPVRLSRLNSASAATFEMLIDTTQVRNAGVIFDERFGAGASLHLGDEFIFITDLLRAGLRGEAGPWVLATHPDQSSGERWDTEHDRHARAVAINRVFGPLAPAIRAAFSARHFSKFPSLRALASFVADSTRPP